MKIRTGELPGIPELVKATQTHHRKQLRRACGKERSTQLGHWFALFGIWPEIALDEVGVLRELATKLFSFTGVQDEKEGDRQPIGLLRSPAPTPRT